MPSKDPADYPIFEWHCAACGRSAGVVQPERVRQPCECGSRDFRAFGVCAICYCMLDPSEPPPPARNDHE